MAVSVELLTQLYLAYFGRPPDVSGVQFYTSNPDETVFTVAAKFSASPEAQELHGSTFGSAQVNAIYQLLFNRSAEADGINYWTQEVASGRLAPAMAAYGILVGAQNSDRVSVQNKLAAAADFYSALDMSAEREGFSGSGAAASARALLTPVGPDPQSLEAFRASLAEHVAYVTGGRGGPGQDRTAPTLDAGASVDVAARTVTIDFTEGLFIVDGDATTLRSAVSYSVDGTTFQTSGIADVRISGDKLVVEFQEGQFPLADDLKIRIQADALADVAKNRIVETTVSADTQVTASAFVAHATSVGATADMSGSLGLYNGTTLVGTSTALTAGVAGTVSVAAQSQVVDATLKVSDAAGNVAAETRAVVLGTTGNDVISGDADAEFIFGFEGIDVILGGGGSDHLIGGAGADKFVYATASHGGDVIVDFSVADGDSLDVSALVGASLSVQLGLQAGSDIEAGNVFVFDATDTTIDAVAQSIADDASVTATDAVIVLRSGGSVQVYHTTDAAANGDETLLATLTGVDITALTAASFV